MANNFGKREAKVNQSKRKSDDDADALFRLPLTEFISARKALAARLKKEGHRDQADRVQALAKPSISAWVVNQLHWQQREAFDRLFATGQDFRRAQSARLAGKSADLRGPLDERREVLSELSKLATELLRDAGHNPSPDMLQRITTTLEAVSAYAELPADFVPGRLTQDIDPPGFASFGAFDSGAAMPARKAQPARVIPFRKETPAPKAQRKTEPSRNERQIEKARQARIAAAKAALQEAKRLLVKAQSTVQNAEAAQKKANADAKEKLQLSREAELRFDKARAASESAARRAQSVAADVEKAAKALRDAEHSLEVASKELESPE
jgi:hypothetical protein